jgi:hypothetical protein
MLGRQTKRNRMDFQAGYGKFKTQFNPYKEALLNPISGPLVGVPTAVPVDTHRARLKATGTITVTSGKMSCAINPVFALCNDAVPIAGTASSSYGPIVYNDETYLWGGPEAVVAEGAGRIAVADSILSNANYAYLQFAGTGGQASSANTSVRGRVVAACARICNVSSANTRNGVFTLFQDPQHTTLQGRTASVIAKDPKARQFNAATSDWHTVTYHPVEPDEVDGWVWNPAIGPQGGVKTGAYNPANNAADGTLADNFPGYMGIFWNGDTGVSQTFQVELYVIAEYVGSLVQPLIRPIGVSIDDAQEAREAAEDATVHLSTTSDGADHSGHPHSDTHPSRAQRALQFAASEAPIAKNIRKVAKMGAVTAAGYFAGPAGATAAAKYLLTPEASMQLAQGLETASDIYAARRARSASAPRSAYATPTSRPRLAFSRGRSMTRR